MISRSEPDATTEVKGELSLCAWPGCTKKGEHKAPVSRDNLREYCYFCLEHVRIYNRAWNYYEGMSDSEVETAVRSDTVWKGPLRRISNDAAEVPLNRAV